MPRVVRLAYSGLFASVGWTNHCVFCLVGRVTRRVFHRVGSGKFLPGPRHASPMSPNRSGPPQPADVPIVDSDGDDEPTVLNDYVDPHYETYGPTRNRC